MKMRKVHIDILDLLSGDKVLDPELSLRGNVAHLELMAYGLQST